MMGRFAKLAVVVGVLAALPLEADDKPARVLSSQTASLRSNERTPSRHPSAPPLLARSDQSSAPLRRSSPDERKGHSRTEPAKPGAKAPELPRTVFPAPGAKRVVSTTAESARTQPPMKGVPMVRAMAASNTGHSRMKPAEATRKLDAPRRAKPAVRRDFSRTQPNDSDQSARRVDRKLLPKDD